MVYSKRKNTQNLVINCEILQFELMKNVAETQIILKSEKLTLIFVKISVETETKIKNTGDDT